MATKTILNPPGIQSFRQFLTNELSSLRQAPILLIASEPAADAVSRPPIRDAARLVHFTMSQQFGLRIVPANISSGFPTLSDVESRRDLLRRTGASSIVAVGSGAAMDLAKALASNDYHNEQHQHQQGHDMEHLILVPSTYSATIASGASHSLLLDQVEETLLPFPSQDTRPDCTVTVAPLEPKYLYISTMDVSRHALYAVTAVVLDTYLRKIDNPQLDSMLHSLQTLHALGDEKFHDQSSHDILLDLCFQAGNHLSYGLGKEDRSTPLALSSSLIPPLFPHIPILTFWASLVPGLCHVLSQGNQKVPTLVQEIVSQYIDDLVTSPFPKLTITDESKQGFSIPDMAISHIQANATVSKSFDMPQQVLTEILKHAIPK